MTDTPETTIKLRGSVFRSNPGPVIIWPSLLHDVRGITLHQQGHSVELTGPTEAFDGSVLNAENYDIQSDTRLP